MVSTEFLAGLGAGVAGTLTVGPLLTGGAGVVTAVVPKDKNWKEAGAGVLVGTVGTVVTLVGLAIYIVAHNIVDPPPVIASATEKLGLKLSVPKDTPEVFQFDEVEKPVEESGSFMV